MNWSIATTAIALLVLGNLAASLSDVAVKMLEGGIATFQYVFLRQLLSVLIIFPFWFQQNKAQRALTARGITSLRAFLIIIGSGCMMIAITHLPLATANAIFYAAPLLMLPLSVLLLKEIPPWGKTLSTMIGFIGVLIVLRPSQFHWAGYFALGTAITLALFNLLARKLPPQQTIVTTLFWTSLISLPITALLAYLTWQPISGQQLALVTTSAALILIYNGLAVKAYKAAPAGQIALAEYSGLVFVVLIGVWGFNEIPDSKTALGILLIIIPLLPLKELIQRRKNK
ncbi:DMT family transporter [Vibrio renipiscarius]|uniref:Multidrug transporter n=1 Tax=Vibrio renipiscarius TaxID=1461322 RepID=A0A0C2KGP4_9VIBR|nr:DMT family transporter [Vibrio renipiscarius]KII77654.1 multidrug transporter [Vibrio renipiscarius]KII81478.1 multidrug transporter [Vibrio renipiscarius]